MTNSNSSVSRHYHQLTSEQRGQIQAMLDSGITSCSAIAREVGCHKSTISREIRRGSVLQRDHNYYEHYYADTAQIYHDKRRRNCYKRDPLKHYAVFLKMLSKRFKAKFDATSIDEFGGEFKQTMPDHRFRASCQFDHISGSRELYRLSSRLFFFKLSIKLLRGGRVF